MNEEKPLKKSYFAKKRHFYLLYHIDYQCSNNFKKKGKSNRIKKVIEKFGKAYFRILY